MAKIYAHLSKPPPELPEDVEASPELRAVIRRAMAKEPADRYSSAGELGREAVAAATGRAPAPLQRDGGIHFACRCARDRAATAPGETKLRRRRRRRAPAETSSRAGRDRRRRPDTTAPPRRPAGCGRCHRPRLAAAGATAPAAAAGATAAATGAAVEAQPARKEPTAITQAIRKGTGGHPDVCGDHPAGPGGPGGLGVRAR